MYTEENVKDALFVVAGATSGILSEETVEKYLDKLPLGMLRHVCAVLSAVQEACELKKLLKEVSL